MIVSALHQNFQMRIVLLTEVSLIQKKQIMVMVMFESLRRHQIQLFCQ